MATTKDHAYDCDSTLISSKCCIIEQQPASRIIVKDENIKLNVKIAKKTRLPNIK